MIAGRWEMPSTSLDRMSIDIPAQSSVGVLCIRMSGDVDLSDNWNLALATPRIRGTGAHTIFVDVGAVTFFGSTIVNFLVHLVATGPSAEVVLCRPTAMARRVVAALSLPSQISVRNDLPPGWIEPLPAPRRPDDGIVAS
jgi:anti-anti-sigma regulatory factor